MSIIKLLKENKLLTTHANNYIYDTELEVVMGSVAYGANTTTSSDIDLYGICVPDMEVVFPHTKAGGYVEGFTERPTNFETHQKHHMNMDGKSYDACIYSIVKAFKLAADNNPNVLDILWVPESCLIRCTAIGHHIRANRQLFLSKEAYHRFRGYAYAQQKRMIESNRTELIEQYGYDVKNAYHIIRLVEQARQILETGDMVLDKNAILLQDIRAGKYDLQNIQGMLSDAEADLEKLYKASDLRDSADTKTLQKVLLDCLEMKYGYLP